MTAITVPSAGRCRRDAHVNVWFMTDERPRRRGRRRPGAACAAPAASAGRFGPGRRAGRGDISAAILTLLAEEPMHGYQIIQVISERSGGNWTPSPGSVYPTLQQLEDEGLIEPADSESGRRVFALTEAGRTASSRRRGRLCPVGGGGRRRRRRPGRAPRSRPPGACRDAAGRPGGHGRPDQVRPGRAAHRPQEHLPAAGRGRVESARQHARLAASAGRRSSLVMRRPGAFLIPRAIETSSSRRSSNRTAGRWQRRRRRSMLLLVSQRSPSRQGAMP